MIVLEKNRIYQGNMVLVNRDYPVRYQQPERELSMIFPEQPEIQMERTSARMLKNLLEELEQEELCMAGQTASFRQAFQIADQSASVREAVGELCNLRPIVGVSGYRTQKEQMEIFAGSLRENGREFTEKYVAFPDHSEHQTGLAIDLAENKPEIDFICPDFPYEGICQRFRERMAVYGFIERYPKEKEKITGIGAEPWHFRYVGTPHAELMQKKGMVLEEYTEWIKQFDLKQRPLILHWDHAEIRIGYVKAQGEYTRIEGLETLIERTRIGYMRMQDEYQDVVWHTCRETEDGREKRTAALMESRGENKNAYSLCESHGRNSIQISGNNQDGFILTCMIGGNWPVCGDRSGRNR